MADDFKTMADLAIINDANAADLGVSDIFDAVPFLNALAADTTPGDTHKYIKETGAPVVGFRAVNTGIEHDKSTDTLVTITLKLLDASMRVDKALADQYKDGPDAFMAREAARHLRAALKVAEKQLLMGTIGGAAAGFSGFANALAAGAMVHYGDDEGDALTSIYFVRTNDSGRDCQLIFGNEGRISIDPYMSQEVQDGDGKHYHAYVAAIMGWIGVQIGSAKSVARIANVGATTGDTCDDDLLTRGLELFPEELQPNLIVMNKRSLFQLQRSRTYTSPTGAMAPLPTDFVGIPIITTSSLVVGETALTP